MVEARAIGRRMAWPMGAWRANNELSVGEFGFLPPGYELIVCAKFFSGEILMLGVFLVKVAELKILQNYFRCYNAILLFRRGITSCRDGEAVAAKPRTLV